MMKPEVLFCTASGSKPVGSAAMAMTSVFCAQALAVSEARTSAAASNSRFMGRPSPGCCCSFNHTRRMGTTRSL
jgi:hypothetical protein